MANEHPTTLSRQVTGALSNFDGDRAKALSEFNVAIARDPGDPWSYAYKGWVLILDGRYGEALSSIDEAIRHNSYAPMYFIFSAAVPNLAWTASTKPSNCWRPSARLSPDDQWAQLLLGRFRLGRTHDAWSAVARFNSLSVALGDFPMSVNLVQQNLGTGKLGYRIAEIFRQENIPEHATDWLSDDQLKLLLLVTACTDIAENSSVTHEASFSADGVITMSANWGSEPGGKARIEGRAFGQVCVEWPSKRKTCAMIFRTYNGTRAQKKSSRGSTPTGYLDSFRPTSWA